MQMRSQKQTTVITFVRVPVKSVCFFNVHFVKQQDQFSYRKFFMRFYSF